MSSRLEDQRAGYCRHCGERLPLIRRVKREEFCSEEHRERFLNSTQSVALDRLRENDPEAQAEMEMEMHAAAVAVAEAPAPQEPPDPPMAGTIGPKAVDTPLRVVAYWEGDENRLGQWEPVRPEPQWQSIALRFGLAEFYETGPAPFQQNGREFTRVPSDQIPAELAAELPRSTAQLSPETEFPSKAAPASEGSAVRPHRIPFAGSVPCVEPEISRMEPQVAAPETEALDLDAMMYLPAFSPDAERQSLVAGGWSLAGWAMMDPRAGQDEVTAWQHSEPEQNEALDAQVAPELPVASSCQILPAEVEPEPEVPAFVAASSDLGDEDLDAELVGEAGVPRTSPQTDLEESAMSETAQSRAEQGNVAGLQALGERIANPFLHDTQPRPGTGRPRWTPVTAELGMGASMATEDWDIL